MRTVQKLKQNTQKKSRGQSLVEYVALTALIAIVCISTVKLFGGKVRSRLNQVTNQFDKNIQNGLKNARHRAEPVDDDMSDDETDNSSIRGSRGRNSKGIFGGIF